MISQGVVYMASVMAVGMAIICAAMGFYTLLRAKKCPDDICEFCGSRGILERHSADGRITGTKFFCECLRPEH